MATTINIRCHTYSLARSGPHQPAPARFGPLRSARPAPSSLGPPRVTSSHMSDALPFPCQCLSQPDLKHPVPFLQCDDLQMAGLTAVSFGFIAEVVAVVMLGCPCAGSAGTLASGPAIRSANPSFAYGVCS